MKKINISFKITTEIRMMESSTPNDQDTRFFNLLNNNYAADKIKELQNLEPKKQRFQYLKIKTNFYSLVNPKDFYQHTL